MDEHALTVSGPDPVPEIAALLRGVAGRALTPGQAADLNAVLDEVEEILRRGDPDPGELAGPAGDLRIIDITAQWGSASAAPIPRAQRDRVRRLLPILEPDRRRARPWRR